MSLILLLSVFVAICIVTLPVMLAAKMVRAGRSGFWISFLAVIVQFAASAVVQALAKNSLIAVLVAIIVGAAIYAWVLRTSWLKGLLIGVIATVIGVIAAFLLFAFGAVTIFV